MSKPAQEETRHFHRWSFAPKNAADSFLASDISAYPSKLREISDSSMSIDSPPKLKLRDTLKRSRLNSSVLRNNSRHTAKKEDRESPEDRLSRSTLNYSSSFVKREKEKRKIKKSIKNRRTEPDQKENIHGKIESLKQVIKFEEKMLRGLNRKVTDEKAELIILQQKFIPQEKSAKKPKVKGSNLNKSALGLVCDKSDTTTKPWCFDALDEAKLKPESKYSLKMYETTPIKDQGRRLKSSLKSSVSKGEDAINRSMIQTRSTGKEKKEKREPKDRSKKIQTCKKKVDTAEKYIKDLDERYNEEIEELRSQLDILKHENIRLRSKGLMEREVQETEAYHEKRVIDLKKVLVKKDEEMKEKENSFKEQIEALGMKMMELNDQMETAMRVREQAKSLNQQLNIKDGEIEATKKYFNGKLLGNENEYHTSERKGWKNINDDMLEEIRDLKERIASSAKKQNRRYQI